MSRADAPNRRPSDSSPAEVSAVLEDLDIDTATVEFRSSGVLARGTHEGRDVWLKLPPDDPAAHRKRTELLSRHLERHDVAEFAARCWADELCVVGDSTRSGWLVDHVDGLRLDAWLATHPPAAAIHHVGEQIWNLGLELERTGTVHGDLEPANIIVCPDDSIRVVDLDGAGPVGFIDEPLERGTSGFQHPDRIATGRVGHHVDAFSIVALCLALDVANQPITQDQEPWSIVATGPGSPRASLELLRDHETSRVRSLATTLTSWASQPGTASHLLSEIELEDEIEAEPREAGANTPVVGQRRHPAMLGVVVVLGLGLLAAAVGLGMAWRSADERAGRADASAADLAEQLASATANLEAADADLVRVSGELTDERERASAAAADADDARSLVEAREGELAAIRDSFPIAIDAVSTLTPHGRFRTVDVARTSCVGVRECEDASFDVDGILRIECDSDCTIEDPFRPSTEYLLVWNEPTGTWHASGEWRLLVCGGEPNPGTWFIDLTPVAIGLAGTAPAAGAFSAALRATTPAASGCRSAEVVWSFGAER